MTEAASAGGPMGGSVLPDEPLDPSGRIPLHQQISTRLRTQILNGSLPPGTRLPSESQLQRTFGVSRSVVRQALASLTAEGLIERGRGRGSTVAPRREHHRLVQRLPGLSTQVTAQGADVRTTVLSIEREPARGATTVLGTPEVLKLSRLRSVDGAPIALIRTWLPLPQCESLTAEELTDASLHATLRARLGIRVVSGTRQVRAVPADPEEQRLLQVPEREPVLLLQGTSVDAGGRVVEVFRTAHRGDRVVFDIEVLGPRPDRATGAADRVEGSSRALAVHPESVDAEDLGADLGGAESVEEAEPADDLSRRALALSRDLAALARAIAARGGPGA